MSKNVIKSLGEQKHFSLYYKWTISVPEIKEEGIPQAGCHQWEDLSVVNIHFTFMSMDIGSNKWDEVLKWQAGTTQ